MAAAAEGSCQRESSALPSSIRATSPWSRTRRSPPTPSVLSAASARSTLASRSRVTAVPYGRRDDRHGEDGASQLFDDDGLWRFFGRNHYGSVVGMSAHLFGGDVDAEQFEAELKAWLDSVYA